MPRKPMQPDEVAESAEKQLISLKQAERKQMQKFMKQRDDIANKNRTIQTLAYAVADTFREVFPGAGGFIELRIKTPDSIATKIKNEFTEVLNKMQENPHIDQEEILKNISKINFKDILAFSVITSVPPQKFRTGDDALNQKLTELAEELETTENRIKAHKRFINANEKKMRNLSNEINELKIKIPDTKPKSEIDKLITDTKRSIISSSNPEDIEEFLAKLEELSDIPIKEDLSRDLKEKTKEATLTAENVEYGEKNKERTEETYYKTLRELQYEMSSYFVSNLAKFSTFKFWGTKPIRQSKLMIKPGFRAVNTGYSVIFSKEKSQFELNFEAQGKGEMDYIDAEFSALGALYHEEQKTKDGLISKKIDMPDFTLIGAGRTKKIEDKVRRKYQEITSIEDLSINLDNPIVEEEYKRLKEYEERIREELKNKYGDNYHSRTEVSRKMNEAFVSAKEHLIQDEIEEEINKRLREFADGEFVKNKIQENEELTTMYNEEKQKLENSNTTNISQQEIETSARIRVWYHIKEREILEYAKNSIPIFTRVNIPSNPQEEVMVYTFTVGESIYRYFYNKLNGLKDENGKYKYEPQEQQKRALLKLTGLFEEDYSNFYTYNKETESFEGLQGNAEEPEL